MKGTTHAATGALITATILTVPIAVNSIGLMCAGAIGALIPDIDITNSKITHYITRNHSDNTIIQNVLKISILNIAGAIFALFICHNIYPLILSLYLSMLSLTAHRTLSHSLFSLGIILAILSVMITNKQLITAIGIGYAVHLIEDMLNVTGVPFLYPIYTKKQRIPIIVNKTLEGVFTICISILCVIKYFS